MATMSGGEEGRRIDLHACKDCRYEHNLLTLDEQRLLERRPHSKEANELRARYYREREGRATLLRGG
ncbi:hypothetical protein ABZ419_11670 [Streptomyces cinnamoneus]|uniref:hypothetical protein n=1 Tax=Streptomyces cinnamoneus TaxID=53446 RepID=UPI0033D9D7D7